MFELAKKPSGKLPWENMHKYFVKNSIKMTSILERLFHSICLYLKNWYYNAILLYWKSLDDSLSFMPDIKLVVLLRPTEYILP